MAEIDAFLSIVIGLYAERCDSMKQFLNHLSSGNFLKCLLFEFEDLMKYDF